MTTKLPAVITVLSNKIFLDEDEFPWYVGEDVEVHRAEMTEEGDLDGLEGIRVTILAREVVVR